MDKSKNKEDKIKNKRNPLGLDPDEQAMNGAYGMVETREEDRANDLDRE